MIKLRLIVSRSALVLVTAASLTAMAEDLSKYRDFQLGTDLPTVAKLTGSSPSEAKVIHSRPELVQELEWRPQPLGSSSKAESAQEVVFTFYGGTLFRIAVKYDRYETEGLTTEDLVEAVSAMYGSLTKLPTPVKPVKEFYGDQEVTVARWEDPQYRFDLLRASYGPTYTLVGILKTLEGPVQAANAEAKRLETIWKRPNAMQHEPRRSRTLRQPLSRRRASSTRQNFGRSAEAVQGKAHQDDSRGIGPPHLS